MSTTYTASRSGSEMITITPFLVKRRVPPLRGGGGVLAVHIPNAGWGSVFEQPLLPPPPLPPPVGKPTGTAVSGPGEPAPPAPEDRWSTGTLHPEIDLAIPRPTATQRPALRTVDHLMTLCLPAIVRALRPVTSRLVEQAPRQPENLGESGILAPPSPDTCVVVGTKWHALDGCRLRKPSARTSLRANSAQERRERACLSVSARARAGEAAQSRSTEAEAERSPR